MTCASQNGLEVQSAQARAHTRHSARHDFNEVGTIWQAEDGSFESTELPRQITEGMWTLDGIIGIHVDDCLCGVLVCGVLLEVACLGESARIEPTFFSHQANHSQAGKQRTSCTIHSTKGNRHLHAIAVNSASSSKC